MVEQNNIIQQQVYYQMTTSNSSFLEMHHYLKGKGIKNNAFFLVLLDPDLAGIDPRDPRLNLMMKQKVFRECMNNFWYFIREVVRVPEQGGSANSGKPYKLHRGNLAMNFCLIHNFNIFEELPRQHGKTIGVVIRILWEFLFGTTNSEMMFINKKHDDSKLNLQRLKEIRAALPDYLRMNDVYGRDGKKLKVKENVETLEHASNGNKIKTLPAARNRIAANSLGRGCTQPRQWYDEYAFMPYNNEVYLSATPAFKTASMNAKRNGVPYGIIITTTPGDLTTSEGEEAFEMKEAATKFDEAWYDFTPRHLHELIAKNDSSSFVYIRFTYQQLGSGEDWFREIVIDMKKKWDAIRREVLLEWSKASDNSPFKKEDLNVVKALIKEPIRTVMLCGFYQFNVYENLNPKYPPLIGVDVSGGFKRDSSTITVIDSSTTKVVADMNCNYISTTDLAKVIYELVTKYMNNAVVNIERNGGYGASVLSKLVTTSIKKNLFYEIKDKVIEERTNGSNTIRKTQKTKVYGLDSSKNTRELLMQILRERMEYHKDKFISPILFKELETLEVKKNGRIEHSSTGHDDQVFSYLLALYIWYEGRDVMERWGIQKSSIKTDQDLEEAVVQIEDKYENITTDLELTETQSDIINEQLEYLQSNNTLSYEQWMQQEYARDDEALQRLLQTRIGQQAYIKKYNVDPDDIKSQLYEIPAEMYDIYS